MSISVIVSSIGAVVAAVGSGMLLARCFRRPRGDLIAWSVALLGLLVSLGAQALGYLTGFDAAIFRAMELGGQVIAPLALTLGLCEVASKSMGARFCARLYIPSLALVATVVLLLDQLAAKSFTKVWPDPAVYYQTPPDYVLMFAVGPVTAIVSLIAVGTVVRRSGVPAWNAVLPAQLMAGAAALMLAYPSLAQLAAYEAHVHLPVHREFSLLCTAAAALTWLAGTRIGALRLDTLRGKRTRPDSGGRWDGGDETGDLEPVGSSQRRGGDVHRSEDGTATRTSGRELTDYGWQDDRDGATDWARGEPLAGSRLADRESGELATADFATGDFVTGDFADFATGDIAAGDIATGDAGRARGWHSGQGREEPDDGQAYGGGWRNDGNREPDRFPASTTDNGERAQLFGQIAIYTLLEDTVDEFDQLTQRVVEQVRGHEPDTLVYIVHAVPSAPLQRILYEVYRDRQSYERHGQQPYVRQFEADRRPYVLATNVIELGLQQAKVSPFPSVTELFGEPGYDTSGFERPDYLRDYGRPSGQPREYR